MSNPTRREYDFIIVGQGIAGTTLAWHLLWKGKRALIVDRGDMLTSSRVAAGLITPRVGKRLAMSWRFAELWPLAKAFYERVEKQTTSEFFACTPMVRIHADQEERNRFLPRSGETRRGAGIASTQVDPQWFQAAHGAMTMEPAGRVDVGRYLDISREFFRQNDCYLQGAVDPADGIRLQQADGVAIVSLPLWNVTARHLVFCQGISATANPRFAPLDFQPAKGEILTLEIPGLHEQRIVHQGVWLAPLGNELFLAGATFQRDDQSVNPSAAGREEILRKLHRFLRLTPVVRDHRAGVRPLVKGRLPVIGTREQFSFFNGLGSKGALRAPMVAGQLARMLVDDARPDREIVWLPRERRVSATRLTEQAQSHVEESLRPGDVAIDATAGNGFDTLFLARSVGPAGRVFALDIQRDAIDRTRARLALESIQHVQLLQTSHADLEAVIPSDLQGRVSVVMFNLGYLPRGDKTRITTAESTLLALQSALRMLLPGGIVTVIAYPGHDGGFHETQRVDEFFQNLDKGCFGVEFPVDPLDRKHPRLYVVTKSSNSNGE